MGNVIYNLQIDPTTAAIKRPENRFRARIIFTLLNFSCSRFCAFRINVCCTSSLIAGLEDIFNCQFDEKHEIELSKLSINENLQITCHVVSIIHCLWIALNMLKTQALKLESPDQI